CQLNDSPVESFAQFFDAVSLPGESAWPEVPGPCCRVAVGSSYGSPHYGAAFEKFFHNSRAVITRATTMKTGRINLTPFFIATREPSRAPSHAPAPMHSPAPKYAWPAARKAPSDTTLLVKFINFVCAVARVMLKPSRTM